jgi:hypothetical protein
VSATAGKLRPRERDNREPTASDAHITGNDRVDAQRVASGYNTGGYSYLGGRVGRWKQDGREEPESSRTWKGRVSAVVAHSFLGIISKQSIAIMNCDIDDGRVVIDVSGPGEVG